MMIVRWGNVQRYLSIPLLLLLLLLRQQRTNSHLLLQGEGLEVVEVNFSKDQLLHGTFIVVVVIHRCHPIDRSHHNAFLIEKASILDQEAPHILQEEEIEDRCHLIVVDQEAPPILDQEEVPRLLQEGEIEDHCHLIEVDQEAPPILDQDLHLHVGDDQCHQKVGHHHRVATQVFRLAFILGRGLLAPHVVESPDPSHRLHVTTRGVELGDSILDQERLLLEVRESLWVQEGGGGDLLPE